MATLRDIKNRISGITSIEKITSAMKMVSSIKSRRSQRQAETARPYCDKIAEILNNIVRSEVIENFNTPLLRKEVNTIKNVAIIVIAGDKGMCGSFNNNLLKYVDRYLLKDFKENYSDATAHFILFGTKAVEYYKKQKVDIIKSYEGVFQSLDFNIIKELRELFVNDYINNKIDRVEVFYNKLINVMKQEPTQQQILPIDIKINNNTDTKYTNTEYIFEPNIEEIFEAVLNQYIDISVWQSLLESNAAEHTARLMAMDKATQNAQELIKELQLQYNNARQAAITTEILEIVGGAEALKK